MLSLSCGKFNAEKVRWIDKGTIPIQLREKLLKRQVVNFNLWLLWIAAELQRQPL